jgi:uncharacterized protein (TIGR04255 family)
MFAQLGEVFASVESTPAGIIPKQLRDQRPELRYTAQFKLKGPNGSLLIGDSMLSLNVERPYPGWAKYRELGVKVAKALHATNLVAELERYSLKYANIINVGGEDPLRPFRVHVDAGGRRMKGGGFRLRFEIVNEPFVSIVECKSDLILKGPSVKERGTLFSIDTICEQDLRGFWDDIGRYLDDAHRVLEELFIELLEPSTIESFGPIWDQR